MIENDRDPADRAESRRQQDSQASIQQKQLFIRIRGPARSLSVRPCRDL
jgi:hypothetical protein